MQTIRDIMKIARCDEATARKLFDLMAGSGLDFSGCSKKEFKRAVLAARDEFAVRQWRRHEFGGLSQ